MFDVRILCDYEEPKKFVDDTVLVETAGYVPRQKTIENLILSGQRLIESRLEEYDGKTVDEALANAPSVRVNGLDVVDSTRVLSELLNKASAGSDSGAKNDSSVSVTEKSEENKSGE